MAKYISYVTPFKETVIIDYRELFDDDSSSVDYAGVIIDVPGSNSDEFVGFIERGNLFVNGVRYMPDSSQIDSDGIFMKCMSEPYVFSVRVSPEQNDYVNGKVIIRFATSSGSSDDIVELYVSDSDVQEIGDYPMDAHVIRGRMNTFMLMRTNPKLTGNIKLVVDSKNRLYLDTFKASSVLNDRVYRKYPVSSDGNYPRDVMTVFGRLPKSELFKTKADSLNPHKYYTDFKQQYATEYEYGAETNTDNMYPENMKILAPIHIGKSVPDFFCIFRYDGVYNPDTYHAADIDDTALFENLLKMAKVIKIFDLRNYTVAGKYIHNYCNMLNQYLHGSCYLQFIEQDNDRDSANYRQGNNSWRGIDVVHGLITNKIESSYFANNILISGDAVQERYNDYIINGYERNNLLYPYILNMEFMFNDTDSDEFTMNRYYGLYLTSNEFQKYSCIITDVLSDTERMVKLDADDNEITDDALIHRTVDADGFSDRIFFMTTNNDAERVQSGNDVKSFIDRFVLDNPDINIAKINAVPVDWKDGDCSFISLTFNTPVHYGEHLRFVCPNFMLSPDSEPENICLEIIASNDGRLLTEDGYISPYVLTNSPDVNYKSGDDSVSTSFYRISFYSQSVTDASVSASVPEQMARIRAAIARFGMFVKVTSHDDSTLCVVSSSETTYFQHIMPLNLYTESGFCQMYVIKKGSKYELHYTGPSVNDISYDSYITSVRSILGDKLVAGDFRDTTSEAHDGKFYTDSTAERAVDYVEYENPDNMIIDSIRYFSRTSDTMMHMLSPDTETYSNMYLALSMFGFENLGWRYSSIVPFKKIADYSWPYEVYDNMDEILKFTKHPLVKGINGRFETIRPQQVDIDYLTDNGVCMLGIDTQTQRLVTNASYKNTCISPYDCSSVMIDFKTQPYSHNSEIALFNPEESALCVMGIMPVRDIDMRIDLDEDIVSSNSKSVVIPSGDVVRVGSVSDNRIQKDCVYRITAGSFLEYPMKEFIMSGKEIRYSTDGSDVITDTFNSGILTASGDVTVEIVDGRDESVLSGDVISRIPSQSDDNFFKDRSNPDNSYLNIPVVPQTNCLWESNGLYFDGNSILDTDELTGGNYVPVGHFTELGASPSLDEGGNAFVKNSVNSYMYGIETGTVRFRDVIKNASVQNIIKKMIIQNGMPDTAVGYYNSYVQTLEFVYYGIKFGLKFNSDYYNQNIHIGEYNNFDIYFINEPDFSDENEMYISVDEQIIVFVNHKFDMDSDRRCGYLQMVSIDNGNGIVPEGKYSAYRAPYSIEADSICGFNNAFVCGKTNGNVVSFSNSVKESYFVQEEHASGMYKSNAYIYPNYVFFKIYDCESNKDWNTDDDVFNISSPVAGILRHTMEGQEKRYITDIFTKSENLGYNTDENNLTKYGSREPESYVLETYSLLDDDDNTDDGTVSSEDDSEKLERYIRSISGNVVCYIIKNRNVSELYITDSYRPLSITMQRPSRIKYNFGYFTPRFYDIVSFNTNDYELGTATGMNMLLGNTSVKSVNRLNTYTGNKVFVGKDEVDVRKNYYITHGRSVMSSNWDMGYYRKYTDNDNYSILNGYIPGIEDKSFFGSRCLVLKNEYIELDDFSSARVNPQVIYTDSVHNVYSENRIQCKISINITQSIYSKFENDQMFVSNWNNSDFSKEQMSTAIGNYIQNSVSEIYNIQRRREVIVYFRRNDFGSEMNVEFKPDPSGYGNWDVLGDYDAKMTTESNEMILTITLSIEQGYTIHPLVKIFRN